MYIEKIKNINFDSNAEYSQWKFSIWENFELLFNFFDIIKERFLGFTYGN